MADDNFRTNTLTLLGAFGYVVFLALVLLKVLDYPVTWRLLGFVLLSSSALLGVDFGSDVFPIQVVAHPDNDDDDTDDSERVKRK